MIQIRLVTTGARTGERREVKLYAFVDGDRLFVLGSGFAPGHRTPGWVHNLRGQPRAEFREGKSSLIGHFVGEVMKHTRGAADPHAAKRILAERLASD